MKKYLELSRIKSWKELSFFSILGILLSQNFDFFGAILVYLATCFAIISIFVVNNIFDAVNLFHEKQSKKPVAGEEIGMMSATLVALGFGFLSMLIFSFFVNLLIPIFALFLGYLYSIPPVRFRERPPFDVAIHGICLAFSFFIAYISFREINITSILFFVGVLIFGAAASLLHQVQDYEIDKNHNLKTTATRFGIKKSLDFSVAMILVSFSIFSYLAYHNLIPKILIQPLVLGFFVPLHLLLKRRDENIVFHIQIYRKIYNLFFLIVFLILVFL